MLKLSIVTKGLVKVYETAKRWEPYAENLDKLAHLYADAYVCIPSL